MHKPTTPSTTSPTPTPTPITMTTSHIPNNVSTEQLQEAMEQARMTTPLTGEALLARVKELGDLTNTELVEACGYVSIEEDGSRRLLSNEFYEALLTAKGCELDLQQSHLYAGLTFEQLIPVLNEKVGLDDTYGSDSPLIHKYMAALIINNLKGWKFDVANAYEKDGDIQRGNQWREDGRLLANVYNTLVGVRISEHDEIYKEIPNTDNYLSEISSESLEVLEHFGAEAPALLNKYSTAIEDALIEQVKKNTELCRELATLKGEVFDEDQVNVNQDALAQAKRDLTGK
jgi:hypothetical protein